MKNHIFFAIAIPFLSLSSHARSLYKKDFSVAVLELPIEKVYNNPTGDSLLQRRAKALSGSIRGNVSSSFKIFRNMDQTDHDRVSPTSLGFQWEILLSQSLYR